LSNTGRLREAIEHYEQVVRLKPDYVDAHNNLGIVLARTGRSREAIEHFEQALRLKSDYLQAYYNLTLTYAYIGRPAEAIATARKALEVARSTGQMVQAKRFEDWLNSYSAGLPNVPNASPASEIPTP
jgi:tetratricopeptide (TPR) repeat protein